MAVKHNMFVLSKLDANTIIVFVCLVVSDMSQYAFLYPLYMCLCNDCIFNVQTLVLIKSIT